MNSCCSAAAGACPGREPGRAIATGWRRTTVTAPWPARRGPAGPPGVQAGAVVRGCSAGAGAPVVSRRARRASAGYADPESYLELEFAVGFEAVEDEQLL